MAERTPHQQRIVKDYYRNRKALALQKIQELVTELYLAESDRARDGMWKRVEKAMADLGVSPELAAHILDRRSPELLAKHIADWWEKLPGERPGGGGSPEEKHRP